MINKLPSLISVFGVLILSLSIVYDYGYFWVFGISFSELPTTFTDHMRSSLVWTPYAFMMIFVVFINELFQRRLEQGYTEEEIIVNSPNPKFTAWFRSSPMYLIAIIALFIPIIFFFDICIFRSMAVFINNYLVYNAQFFLWT